MKKCSYIICCFLLACVAFTACVDDKMTTDPSAVLSFSCDTLSFDTMFTNVPSRTMSFCIYNRNKLAVNISSIRLGRGASSYFRYNLDGRVPPESKVLENIEVRGRDSLFVFVEMTADQNEADFPVYYLDSLIFVTNGVTQNVKLQVFGQDAIILNGYTLSQNSTFTAQRPYLIFNYLYVPESKTLTLEAGTHLYFHDKANLVVDGNLQSNGTQEQPVLMRTDRFDCMPDVDKTPYDYMPGQWGGVYLQNAHGNYVLNHTQIRSCDIGVVLVGTALAQPTLKITNSILHTMSQYGLYSQNGIVEMSNCELSNCGTSCFYQLGGESHIVQTTIANYYEWGTRQDVAMVISNYLIDGSLLYVYPVNSAVVENSIVFGNKSSELSLLRDTITQATFNVLISNSLIKKRKQTSVEYSNNFWANSLNPDAAGAYRPDTVFVNTAYKNSKYYNFQLSPNSRARGKGNVSVAAQYPTDMLGKDRTADGAPDLGAYEY